jgi:hypothetical protein
LMRSAAAVLIALAAICLQRAATLPWATLPIGGGQIYVSPIGARVKDDVGGTAGACRWWPKMGDAWLCEVAPGGSGHFRRLRRAYPLLAAAMWVAVTALFLQVLRLPRPPMIRAVVSWLVSGLTVAAIASLMMSMQHVLAIAASRPPRFAESGFLFACSAVLLSAVSGALAVLKRT